MKKALAAGLLVVAILSVSFSTALAQCEVQFPPIVGSLDLPSNGGLASFHKSNQSKNTNISTGLVSGGRSKGRGCFSRYLTSYLPAITCRISIASLLPSIIYP